MDPAEVTVIVYQAKGLQGKKKGKHKYNVTFGINNNKARSESEDSQDGAPVWNTEAQIKVDDPMEPLIVKVKDKDDILGQVTLHMHELPNSKPARPKHIPLQPHKKAPDPHGELVFMAWISAYAEAKQPSEKPAEKDKSSSTLKKMKGAVSHSPLMNKRFSLTSKPDDNRRSSTLSSQMSRMSIGGVSGSQESIESTVSGFSTMSESTKKKKSALKKLKGAFKKPPILGGSKMAGKNASQSCMDLSAAPSNMMQVHNIQLDGSQESLASQTSGFSNLSENKDKKSKNPFKKLKSKMTSKSKLDKSNSKSMYDIAFGATPMIFEDTVHGSSESLDKLKTSAMDKNFPNKFDLTVPKALLNKGSVAEEDRSEQQTGHKRTGSDTASIHSTGSSQKVATPDMQQKRRMSYQTRSLRDDPRERPKPENSPKSSPKNMPGSSEVHSPSTGSGGGGRSLCIPRDDTAAVRSPALGSSREDIRSSKHSIHSHTADSVQPSPVQSSLSSIQSQPSPVEKQPSPTQTQPSPTQTQPSPAQSQSSHTQSQPSPVSRKSESDDSPSIADSSSGTPEAKGGLLTTKKLVSEEDHNKPEISGVSPSRGTVKGGTKITIRGSNLGVDKSDVVWLSICGANCLATLEYFSEYKLRATTKAWKPGTGKIVIETQSGGKSKSLVDFTFEEEIVEEDGGDCCAEKAGDETPQKAADQSNASDGSEPKTSVNKVSRKEQTPMKIPVVVLADPLEQKREDPEGMTMTKDEQQADFSNKPISGDSKTEPLSVTVKESSMTVRDGKAGSVVRGMDSGSSNEQLLLMIKALKEENQTLKEDNVNMKVYMNKIIDRVIDRCPDVLCVDAPAIAHSKHA